MPDLSWGEYGLIGLMIGGIYAGIAWAGARLLGKEGVLDQHAKALNRVADCVETHSTAAAEDSKTCHATGVKVGTLHQAAIAALGEIADECRHRGMDVDARVTRIRQILEADD